MGFVKLNETTIDVECINSQQLAPQNGNIIFLQTSLLLKHKAPEMLIAVPFLEGVLQLEVEAFSRMYSYGISSL